MKRTTQNQQTRGERRATLFQKKISAPRGGTLAGQAARLVVQRGMAGLPKALKPRVRIHIGKKESRG
ncbi:MAG: hypothetical protein Q8P56_04630 [Candidatus Uhrbacteria bacterium]|nr:hypothetical protein [Candidatus Uhrbacteria bacterium]